MINMTPITDLNTPELAPYAGLSETQLLHYYEPENGLFIAESPKVIDRAINAGYMPVSFLTEHNPHDPLAWEIFSHCPEVPIYTASTEILSGLTGFHLTRGMLALMNRKELPGVEAICTNVRRVAVLENVMNPTNIGAIFRSAAALNIDAVLLTPGCSDPLYRRAARVSMGTVFQIPWTYILDPKNPKNMLFWPDLGLQQLKCLGFQTAAMALSDDSISIDDPVLMSAEKLAIILGTEGDGLSRRTIAECDYTVRIPMTHGVDSLNVAAASAVAFWQLGKMT